MTTKIQKWGNSLAVRLPKKILGSLPIKEHDAVLVHGEGNRIVISRAPESAKPLRKEAWCSFIIPMKKKKRVNVSNSIDAILYGAPH